MNVMNLVIEGTVKVVALACGRCGRVYDLSQEVLVEECCKPSICSKCGVVTRAHWTVCDPCRVKKDAEREAAKFEAAPKVAFNDYQGRYLQSDAFNGEGFVETASIEDDLFDVEPKVRPRYAWACEPRPLPRILADDVLENNLDDYHEDAIDWLDVNALQKALDDWHEKQPRDLSFFPTETAVLLDEVLEELAKEDKRGQDVETA